MSVLRQQNWLGQQRVDVPHLRSLDSAISADFDLLAGSVLSGSKALVVRGFDLVTSGAVGNPATSLQLNVAGGILMHQGASEAGTIFSVVDDATIETLNSTNPNVSGSFTPSQVNYLGLDLVRAADSETSDLVMFWDPNSSDETPKTVPLARTLGYRIVVSTTDFDSAPNVLPLAKVTTNNLNVVTAVEDARQLAFRLGSGGSSPDALNTYAWPQGRNEATATTIFSGGDKAVSSLKDWLDAAMTRLWELGGGEHWYSATADRNVTLVSTGTTFANGENFSWDGTNLTWQGLQFLFDNSTGWYNEVKAQTTSSAGLTDLADGDCIYVDLDRTQNLSGASGLVPVKTALVSMGQGSVPGARQVIAWRRSTMVFTRGSKYPVGAMFTPASTTALGLVKLSKAPTDSLNPVVLTDTEKNAASGVAALDAGRQVIGTGVTRDSAGTLSIGTGANDSAVTISKTGATSTVAGALSVAQTLAVTGTSTLTGRLTASNGITITTGNLTVTAGGITVSAGGVNVTGASSFSGLLTVSAGGASIAGGIAIPSGGINLTGTGGIIVTAGSVTATNTGGVGVQGTGSTIGVKGTGTASGSIGVEGIGPNDGVGGHFATGTNTSGNAIQCDGYIDMRSGLNPIGAANIPKHVFTSGHFPMGWGVVQVGNGTDSIGHAVNLDSAARVGTDQFIVRLPFSLASTSFGAVGFAQAMLGSSFFQVVVASKVASDGSGLGQGGDDRATCTFKLFDMHTSPPTQVTNLDVASYNIFVQFWY